LPIATIKVEADALDAGVIALGAGVGAAAALGGDAGAGGDTLLLGGGAGAAAMIGAGAADDGDDGAWPFSARVATRICVDLVLPQRAALTADRDGECIPDELTLLPPRPHARPGERRRCRRLGPLRGG
jgi:hypothetical protein